MLLYRPEVPRGLSKTLYSPWEGPWTVKRKMPNTPATYEITRDNKTRVTNLMNLRRFVTRDANQGQQQFFQQRTERKSTTSPSVPEQMWQAVWPVVQPGNTSAGDVTSHMRSTDQRESQESLAASSAGVQQIVETTNTRRLVPVVVHTTHEIPPDEIVADAPITQPPSPVQETQDLPVEHHPPPLLQEASPAVPLTVTRSGRSIKKPNRFSF